MRFQKLCGRGLICTMALLLAGTCSALSHPYVVSGSVTVQGDGIPRITAQELLILVRRRKAILVDVRGLDAYKDRHIKGARSIPVDQIEARLKELPRGQTIATYCS